MNNIQIGTIVLNGSLMMALVFGAAGWWAVRLRSRRSEHRAPLVHALSNAFWIWLVIWKASYALFHPADTFREPMSLVYFDGGWRGVALASAAAAWYGWHYLTRRSVPARVRLDALLVYMLAGWTAAGLLKTAAGAAAVREMASGVVVPAMLLAVYWMIFSSADGKFRPAAATRAADGKPLTKGQAFRANAAALLLLSGLVVYGVYETVVSTGTGDDSEETANFAEGAEQAALRAGIATGEPAPDFELKNLDGASVRLSDYRGSVVLLNFWASWCPPCRVEMPHMQRFYQDYAAKGVVVLGVNLTATEEHPDRVRPFVEKRQLTFPVVLDEKGEVMKAYQVVGYPTTYLIDEDGTVREKFVGVLDYEKMKKAVSRARRTAAAHIDIAQPEHNNGINDVHQSRNEDDTG